ncbi:unnamed protein product [Cylicostephanus goldi]|uniref:Uncharacterized protein n=1 Tax=Cylicostephanus goldi TaxID=71465 RepID=A0A3P6SDL0_CYLGO|nr:unnamed protein product [Cylicostephanus goldi]
MGKNSHLGDGTPLAGEEGARGRRLFSAGKLLEVANLVRDDNVPADIVGPVPVLLDEAADVAILFATTSERSSANWGRCWKFVHRFKIHRLSGVPPHR